MVMSVYDDCTIPELEALYDRAHHEALRYQDRRLARRSAWGRERDGGDDMIALTMAEIANALRRKRALAEISETVLVRGERAKAVVRAPRNGVRPIVRSTAPEPSTTIPRSHN